MKLVFLPVLTLIFIALKLGEIGAVASWSWWWILSPLWIPVAAISAFLLLVATSIFIGDATK